MYQDWKHTCTAIVLLIEPSVWCHSRRRRGLLKLHQFQDGGCNWWGISHLRVAVTSVHNLSFWNSFSFTFIVLQIKLISMVKRNLEISYLHGRLCTRTRFGKEVKRNLEISYWKWWAHFSFRCIGWKFGTTFQKRFFPKISVWSRQNWLSYRLHLIWDFRDFHGKTPTSHSLFYSLLNQSNHSLYLSQTVFYRR